MAGGVTDVEIERVLASPFATTMIWYIVYP